MNKALLRSPLFYVGDKFKLIEEIRAYFPQNINRFVEPFVGGGSVFLNVEANEYLLNDIDENVIALHKFLCSYSKKEALFLDTCYQYIDRYGFSCSAKKDIVPQDLKQQYVKTYYAKFNKEPYLKLREDYNKSSRQDFFELYLLLIYGFNHMIRFNARGDFNLPVGNVDFNNNVEHSLLNYFTSVSSKQIQWSSLDFRMFLKRKRFGEDDFVYCDPPYLITFSEYNKLWDEASERDLLAILDKLNKNRVKFAISNVTHYKGKENSLFIDWAKNYKSHSIKSNYISYHDNSVKKFQEVLVTNY